jgi:Tfp pilus assembly protein FimT
MVKYNPSSPGFTIIEIIIIISILIILLNFATPKIINHPIFLKNETRKLCWEIRNLRTLNMSESEFYEITLTQEEYTLSLGTKDIRKTIINNSFQIFDNFNDKNGMNSEISFSHDGAPSYAGTIEVMNRQTRQYMRITIVPYSGRVQLDSTIYSR